MIAEYLKGWRLVTIANGHYCVQKYHGLIIRLKLTKIQRLSVAARTPRQQPLQVNTRQRRRNRKRINRIIRIDFRSAQRPGHPRPAFPEIRQRAEAEVPKDHLLGENF